MLKFQWKYYNCTGNISILLLFLRPRTDEGEDDLIDGNKSNRLALKSKKDASGHKKCVDFKKNKNAARPVLFYFF